MKVKRFDKTLPLPERGTDESAGLDLVSRIDIDCYPKKVTLVPLNVAVDIPRGYFGLLAARSSLPLKMGLTLANGIGVIDSDYNGDEDEIMAAVIPVSDTTVHVRRGDRIAQLLVVPASIGGMLPEVEEVQKLAEKNRGGYGSTGGYSS